MTRLFAAHFAEEPLPIPVTGHYDPEQELWVGDNQALGQTINYTGTVIHTITYGTTSGIPPHIQDPDTDTDKDYDEDSAPDN